MTENNAPISSSRWTTGEDVEAHMPMDGLPADSADQVEGHIARAGADRIKAGLTDRLRAFDADGEDDVEGHIRRD